MTQPHIEQIHYDFRKFCHLTEYAVFALLLWRAIRRANGKNPRLLVAPERSAGGWNWAEAGLAISMVFLYGASDEIHQAFVPNRTAQISDVLIDTAGGAAGLLALWIVFNWRKRLKNETPARAAVVSCYAIGLLLAAIFQPPLTRCSPFRSLFSSSSSSSKNCARSDLAAPRRRWLDESRQSHRHRFTKRFADAHWQ